MLITSPFLVSRYSIWRIHYGELKVDKLSDFDKNWFPWDLRDYEFGVRFSKLKMMEEIFFKYSISIKFCI